MFPPKENSDLCEYPFPQTIESSDIYHAVVEENKTTTLPDAFDLLEDFSIPLEYEVSPIAFLVPFRHPGSTTMGQIVIFFDQNSSCTKIQAIPCR